MVKTITLGEGKYTIIYDKNNQYPVKCLRYGQDWRDLTGDNLIFYLCNKITELTERLADKENEIENNILMESDYMSDELESIEDESNHWYDNFCDMTV